MSTSAAIAQRRRGPRGLRLAVVGAALGGALLVAVLRIDPYTNPDSHAFVALAQNVGHGRGLVYEDQGVPGFPLKAFRPPLYPLLLGGFAAAGLPLEATIPLQGALCGVGVVIVAMLAARAVGARAAWIAAGAALLWWPAWISAGQFLTETLYMVLLAGTMLATQSVLAHGRSRAALGAGLLAGAGVLARATGVAAVLGCAILIGMRAPRLLTAFALGVIVLWGAWAVRNRVALGDWVWLQTSGGLNVWVGTTGAPVGEAWTVMARELPTRGEVGMDREFHRRARAWASENPRRYFARVGERALAFVVSLDRSLEFLPYRLAFPFVILGALAAWRDPRWTLPLLVWALHGALGAFTVMSPRYRLPAEWPAVLVGTAGVEWMTARWGARRAALVSVALLTLSLAAWGAQTIVRGGGR